MVFQIYYCPKIKTWIDSYFFFAISTNWLLVRTRSVSEKLLVFKLNLLTGLLKCSGWCNKSFSMSLKLWLIENKIVKSILIFFFIAQVKLLIHFLQLWKVRSRNLWFNIRLSFHHFRQLVCKKLSFFIRIIKWIILYVNLFGENAR